MSDTEGNAILQEILSNEMDSAREAFGLGNPLPSVEEDKPSKKDGVTFTQWSLGGNGRFMPVGLTVPSLPAGIYETFASPQMWGVERLNVSSDNIYMLPDMATEEVLAEVQKFWASEEKYRQHHLLYKRGIILWGPPGGGKTVTVKILMNELVRRDGIVIFVSNVALAVTVLKAIRRIEPSRKLIVVMEDIDEIIGYSGEAQVLAMLDGENNIDNVLNLATTNHPERLGDRIMNRPSRFDRRIQVGMPSDAARRGYLQQATNEGLSVDNLDRWVKDTDGMSIAHLRELVASVYCLEQPYEEVVDRLDKMRVMVKADLDSYKKNDLGFGAGRKSPGFGPRSIED